MLSSILAEPTGTTIPHKCTYHTYVRLLGPSWGVQLFKSRSGIVHVVDVAVVSLGSIKSRQQSVNPVRYRERGLAEKGRDRVGNRGGWFGDP